MRRPLVAFTELSACQSPGVSARIRRLHPCPLDPKQYSELARTVCRRIIRSV
ncbi:hypothetical protein PISMIDRAFT_681799 [Pisolithus microcarpus 441]|uniref:Uncharacterized protein n=1 Tax=Pisolithus microcarpus 441 TaxID=765257 RepID=A0A0C9ZMD4_9AGAM|nr:hypothetical protein PISMIDRAFT_681799 [Pisolithus microcarpus 441]